MNLSRRDFLKLFGAGAATLGVGAKLAPPALTAQNALVPNPPQNETGVLIDTTRCIGCKQCQVACKQANNLPTDDCPAALSATTFTIVDFRNVAKSADQPVIKPVKLGCMHCEYPACASVCPVGAIEKTATGAVIYDADKCIGCRYCMTACPFGIPKYDWNSPSPKIRKCAQGCMADGKRDKPACVQACPAQTLAYGSRQELLTIAKTRIKENPTKYVNHVYGENEVGGMSRLYLSAVPFDQFGFRTDLPKDPLPQFTWNAMEKIPAVLGGLAVLLSGIAWWTHRNEPKPATLPINQLRK